MRSQCNGSAGTDTLYTHSHTHTHVFLPSSFPVNTLFSHQAERNGDPPPEALARIVKILQDQRESNEDDLAVPLSFCGRVANALIWEEGHWELITQHIQVGTFIRLRNVDIRRWQTCQFRCKSRSFRDTCIFVDISNQLSDVDASLPAALMIHSKTWLTPVPCQNFEVRQLLKAHNHRVLRREYNPKSGILSRSTGASDSRDPTLNGNEERNFAGLKQFVDQAELGTYTGLVTLKVVPENLSRMQLLNKLERRVGPKIPVVLVTKDESTEVVALASELVCRKLLHLLSDTQTKEQTWNDIISKNVNCNTYAAAVRSVDWDNRRYFVLSDLLPGESGGYNTY
jgi:hypothetical protein